MDADVASVCRVGVHTGHWGQLLIVQNTTLGFTNIFALFHTIASCKYCTFPSGTYVIFIFGEKHYVCLMPIKRIVLY